MTSSTLIFETVHGSTAYGLARAGSDIDRKGIFVAGPEAFLGYRPWPEQIEHTADHVHYDIRKFFVLAVTCNPTVIELLFTDPGDHLAVTPEGQILLDNRRLFLSRRARDSFGRYGLSQLKRIRSHRRWLLDPPSRRPERSDFGLTDVPKLSKDQLGAAEALLDRGSLEVTAVSAGFLDILDREQRYRAATREWQQYQEWLRNRNPARSALEAKFGYDTKHAMHLVRLLRMAQEILEFGEVRVKRPDAAELLAIRDGALPYDELLVQAERLEKGLETLAARSRLPESPDEVTLDALCVRIVTSVHRPAGA